MGRGASSICAASSDVSGPLGFLLSAREFLTSWRGLSVMPRARGAGSTVVSSFDHEATPLPADGT
jgi:hypothetical protein